MAGTKRNASLTATSSQPGDDPLGLTGQIVGGKYLVAGVLGHGGMGVVYRATHRNLGTPCAIKFLTGLGSRAQGASAQRFEREARIGATLQIQEVVRVFDLDRHTDGTPYLVMELLAGESLASRLERSTLSEPDAIQLATALARPLAQVHAAGVFHRDLKPENVFLCHDGQVKILDFGIAHWMSDARQHRLTLAGALVGTPHYMSPEQASSAQDIDHRTDIYSLGALLYHALTGQPLHDGPDVAALLAKIVGEEPADLRQLRPDVSEDLANVLRRCYAKDRDTRYQTMGELLSALRAVPASAEAPAPPRRRAAGVRSPLLAIAVLAAACIVTGVRLAVRTGSKPIPAVTAANMCAAPPAVSAAPPRNHVGPAPATSTSPKPRRNATGRQPPHGVSSDELLASSKDD